MRRERQSDRCGSEVAMTWMMLLGVPPKKLKPPADFQWSKLKPRRFKTLHTKNVWGNPLVSGGCLHLC